MRPLLLADAEGGEDAAQKFISRAKAGDLPEGTLRVAQLLGDQFCGAAGILRELAAGKVDGYGYDCDMVE